MLRELARASLPPDRSIAIAPRFSILALTALAAPTHPVADLTAPSLSPPPWPYVDRKDPEEMGSKGERIIIVKRT